MLFLYISLPSLHVYEVYLPTFAFYGGWELKTMVFLFFCERKFTFWVMFLQPLPLLLPKLLIFTVF